MLVELRIRDFAIIDRVELEFGPGLNVLSGETGAGKTIIMNALGLLLGARASPELIRRGKKEAVIEALFQLDGDRLSPELVETLELQDGDQLSIRRIVGDQGRSRVLVNDSLSTVQALGRVAPNFVQIY